MTKRKRKRLLILLLSLLAAGGIAFGIVKWVQHYNKYHVSADEWLAAEIFFYEDMMQVAVHTDSTTSLYLNGNLDQTAYLEQMDVVRQEMNLFLYQRSEKQKLYKIDIDSYTLSNKAGIEAADNCYQLLKNLIEDCMKNAEDKDKLTYLYLSYKDRIYEEVAIFETCIANSLLVQKETSGTTEEIAVIQKETTDTGMEIITETTEESK